MRMAQDEFELHGVALETNYYAKQRLVEDQMLYILHLFGLKNLLNQEH